MHARAALDVNAAYQTVIAVADEAPAFTTDDVWARLGETSDGRAIANALIRAEAEGRIRNSRIGVYLRGQQKHRRWLAFGSLPLALQTMSTHSPMRARRQSPAQP
jgi:hypothetical protein